MGKILMEHETNQLLGQLHINEVLEYDESIPILTEFMDAEVNELSPQLWHLESDTYILIIDFNSKTYKHLTKPYEDIESEGFIFNFHGEVIGEISQNQSFKNLQEEYNIKLNIGKSLTTGDIHYWEFANTNNKNYNIIIEGKPTKSKYHLTLNFIAELSKHNIPSIVIDTNNNFKDLDDLIPDKVSHGVIINSREKEHPDNKELVNANIVDKVTEKYKDLDDDVYKRVVEKASHKTFNTNKNVKKTNPKLPFNPFKKYKIYSANGFTEEDNSSVARRFIRMIHNIYPDMAADALNELYFITIKSLEKYRNLNLSYLKNELDMIKADGILDSLKSLFEDEPFANGGKYDWSYLNEFTGKVKIIDLSPYSQSTQKFIYEVILYDLYNFKITEGFFDFPFFAVLDNSENINFMPHSIINEVLVKGREYGFSIALLIDGENNIKTLNRLNTVEDRIYFRPQEKSVDYIADLLENLDKRGKSWRDDLLNLEDDECIISLTNNRDNNDENSSNNKMPVHLRLNY